MTRINCIPPHQLTDKHLVAEYRELPRVFKLARHGDDIPEAYKLGTGHVKFFYNKLGYLVARQHAICAEMTARGFTVNHPASGLADINSDASLYGDWTPTPEAIALNTQRINERLGK